MDLGVKQISIQNYQLLELLSKYFIRTGFVLHAIQRMGDYKNYDKNEFQLSRKSSKKLRKKVVYSTII